MHLLTVDKEIDGGRQCGKGVVSNGYTIIAGRLHKVIWEVGGGKGMRNRCRRPGVPAGSQSHDGRPQSQIQGDIRVGKDTAAHPPTKLTLNRHGGRGLPSPSPQSILM
jgi:hypothetical protein